VPTSDTQQPLTMAAVHPEETIPTTLELADEPAPPPPPPPPTKPPPTNPAEAFVPVLLH